MSRDSSEDGARLAISLRVRVSGDQLADLEAQATRQGRSVAAVVRDAVTEYLARQHGQKARLVIGDELDRVLRAHVDRLARLSAKGVWAAEMSGQYAAAIYRALYVAHGPGDVEDLNTMPDPAEMRDRIEPRVAAYLKRGRVEDGT